MTEIDVELQRDASLLGVVGSVGRPDDGSLAVAILDSDWRSSGMEGIAVPPDSQIARLAAHLAVNEHGGEAPWPDIDVKGSKHYRVDSSYIYKAAKALDEG